METLSLGQWRSITLSDILITSPGPLAVLTSAEVYPHCLVVSAISFFLSFFYTPCTIHCFITFIWSGFTFGTRFEVVKIHFPPVITQSSLLLFLFTRKMRCIWIWCWITSPRRCTGWLATSIRPRPPSPSSMLRWVETHTYAHTLLLTWAFPGHCYHHVTVCIEKWVVYLLLPCLNLVYFIY